MNRTNILQIKNFGPINEAKIEVAPLTVFVGPDNSGKTYVSLAIYSFKNILSKNTTNKDLQKSSFGKLFSWLFNLFQIMMFC